jgi:hypothetical protein
MIMDYRADLNQRYWGYQKSHFSTAQSFFERPYAPDGRPPVFVRREAWRNVIVNPVASRQEMDRLIALIPEGERHKWFGSMNSSQALAQSVFGNLTTSGSLHYLSELKDDEGLPLFGKAQISSDYFEMEHKIDFLGERRSTRLDGYIPGDYRIAIECKFSEVDVVTCSRPRLKPTASKYCNGTYSIQRARKKQCSLAESGVLYWRYIPGLFKWKNDSDLIPCPLNKNYQLVRNVLAVGVKPDDTVSPNYGHVILIYDGRNPAFHQGGKGLMAYTETRKELLEPTMLRKCSWQCIVQHMREKAILPWLTEQLDLKYGL